MRHLILFAFLFTGTLHAAWDLEYWQYFNFKVWKNEKWLFYGSGELRLNQDISRLYFYRGTLNLAYQTGKNINLEAHYSHIYAKPPFIPHYQKIHRIDLEINPFTTFENEVSLKSRNRLEIIKNESIKNIIFILRQRTMLIFPLKNCGSWTHFRIHNELFYSFPLKRFEQNRFIPCEWVFRIDENTNLNIFIMLRNWIQAGRWLRSINLGTNLEF